MARTQLGRGLLEGACVAGLLIWTATLSIAYDGILTTRVELDRAEVWVKPQEAFLEPLIDYVDAQVPFGEPLFVYGHEAQWYFLTNRYTPRAFSQIYPGMTGDETGEQLAGLIEMTRPRVILQGVLRWPGIPDLVPYTRALGPTFERLYTPDSNAFPNPPKIQMLRVWRLRD